MISFRLEANETLSPICQYSPICLIPFSGSTRLRLRRSWPRSFLHHKDLYEQLKLASVDLYISWRSAPGTLRMSRICPTPAGLSQLQEAVHRLHVVVAPAWQGVFPFVFAPSGLCLLLCIGWWMGAFQKYKHLSHLSPGSTHPIAQHSTVLVAEPFLYSLCTGQGFFHFMHHP